MDDNVLDRLTTLIAGEDLTRREAARTGIALVMGLAGALSVTRLEANANKHEHRHEHQQNQRQNQRRRDNARGGCGEATRCTYEDLSGGSSGLITIDVGPFPGDSIPLCWRWSALQCLPCDGTDKSVYDAECNSAYPECKGRCTANS
jgi:hypothetical protein